MKKFSLKNEILKNGVPAENAVPEEIFSEAAPKNFAKIMPFDGGGKPYVYSVPERFLKNFDVGSLVKIPLGKRAPLGIVWEKNAVPAEKFLKKIREISEICYNVPVLAPDEIRLCEWISGYYAAPLNSVLTTILPSAVRSGIRPLFDKKISLVRELSEEEFSKFQRRAKKQAELYLLLKSAGTLSRSVLNFSAGTINSLISSGIAAERAEKIFRTVYAESAGTSGVPEKKISLNEEQNSALTSILSSIEAGNFKTHLLHGVTGSGKTEVYIEAIRAVLKRGGSAIFLVPEVALTPQTVERLRRGLENLGTKVVVWHSHLSAGERFDAWMEMALGNAKVLVGARSAVFAPLKNLRLIVVDEEHESSFKQGETPFYHGRDVAVFRANLCGAVCVLGSATPSLESFFNAKNGKYVLNRIEKRVDDRSFPQMKILDMRREILRLSGQSTFSKPLLDAIAERLRGREQCILFLNRRGYSRAVICPSCGNVVNCPHCSSALTFHRENQTLRCHLCGHFESAGTRCLVCGNDEMKKRGFGTQRAEEILRERFPDAKIVRLDADTMGKKNEFRKILGEFREGKIDILLGTQMIAKGLDFPRVTLAAIIDADLSLHIPDFRAAERTFQLLVQVAGRAGRGDLDGEVFVQTFTPHAAPIQFAKRAEFDEFLEDELENRAQFGYPPFRHIIRHVFRGNDEKLVAETAENWTKFFEKNAPEGIEIRGPAACPTEKIQDNFRYHVWYFCARISAVISKISALRAAFPFPNSVVEILDSDPADTN